MTEIAAELDPLSEMLALSSYANTKNVLVTAAELIGPCDLDAFKLAVRKTSEVFPQSMCSLRETRKGGLHRLFRECPPDRELPFEVTDLRLSRPDASVFDNLVDHLKPYLDRQWDLFSEPAGAIHIVRVSADYHVLVVILHHAAADIGTSTEMARNLFEDYDGILTGTRPDWPCQPQSISTARKRMVAPKSPGWRKRLADARDAIGLMFEKAALPAGKGTWGDDSEHHVKRVLTEEETEELTQVSLKNGVSLVDLLVASLNKAVDSWNEARNVAPGLLTTSMSVNMKGRYRGFERPNNSGLIFFRSTPEERRDAAAFARSLALARIKQFRQQSDLKFYRDVHRLNTALRPFSLGTRRRITNFIMNRHQFSLAVAPLGVIWPASKNGKLTVDSCLTRAGELAITEVHGIGYKLLSNTPILLSTYFFRNRLNFILAAAGTLFTHEEAEGFLELTVNRVLAEIRS